MTKAKYSPSTKGIYPVSAYSEFPEDALDIPDDIYSQYLNTEIFGFDVVDGVVVAYIPSPPNPNIVRIAEIDARLSQIDLLSIRALRAINSSEWDMDADVAYLATLETEASALRAERATLAEQ